MRKNILKLIISLFVLLMFAPSFPVTASYYTLPIPLPYGNDDITSWMDHASPTYNYDDIMKKYDGNTYLDEEADLNTCSNYNDGAGCYDGHNGTDFAVPEYTDILAVDGGKVMHVDWENPSVATQGYGFYIRLYHFNNDQSTLYAHLNDVSLVSLNDYVIRGQHIGESGSTGVATGPHLHFSVYDGDTTALSSSIDPYGWSGGGSDPWTPDQGYLWTTTPPSLTVPVSGTINSNSTWGPNVVHLLNGSVTLAASASIDVQPGAIVKFQTDTSKFLISGDLNVNGTASSPSYFTSYHDDAVGGDTNSNATSSYPGKGDWLYIQTNSGSSVSFDNTEIRYGSYGLYTNNGGNINIVDSVIASNSSYGLNITSSSVDIQDSTIRDNGNYGINISGNGSLTLQNNNFINNTSAAGFILLGFKNITASGNTASGNTGDLGMHIKGTLYTDQTWADSLPYIITTNSVTVSSGKTLNINPGTIIKPQTGASTLYVDGTLNVLGSSSAPVYFTSIKDDVIGGDTNNDDSASTPVAGNWRGVRSKSGGTASISYAFFRYGGNSLSWTLNSYGGNMDVTNSVIASSTWGFKLENGGTGSISSSSFLDVTGYGVLSQVSSNVVSAQYNWWGASDGPGGVGSGSGSAVSNYVDYEPFETTQPSWP